MKSLGSPRLGGGRWADLKIGCPAPKHPDHSLFGLLAIHSRFESHGCVFWTVPPFLWFFSGNQQETTTRFGFGGGPPWHWELKKPWHMHRVVKYLNLVALYNTPWVFLKMVNPFLVWLGDPDREEFGANIWDLTFRDPGLEHFSLKRWTISLVGSVSMFVRAAIIHSHDYPPCPYPCSRPCPPAWQRAAARSSSSAGRRRLRN